MNSGSDLGVVWVLRTEDGRGPARSRRHRRGNLKVPSALRVTNVSVKICPFGSPVHIGGRGRYMRSWTGGESEDQQTYVARRKTQGPVSATTAMKWLRTTDRSGPAGAGRSGFARVCGCHPVSPSQQSRLATTGLAGRFDESSPPRHGIESTGPAGLLIE